MENSFLSEFKKRNYFNQCTNSEELEQLMNKNKIRAYIGFDCTAPSLHVGSFVTNNVPKTVATARTSTNCFIRRWYNTYR